MRTHRENWRDIALTLRLALDPRKVVLGTVGVLMTLIVLMALSIVVSPWWPGARAALDRVSREPGQVLRQEVQPRLARFVESPAETTRRWTQVAIGKVLPTTYSRHAGIRPIAPHTLFVGAAGLALTLFIWSFFGGAIARIAALDFAKGKRLEIGEATEFSARKFGSFFWSPVVPLAAAGVLVVCMMALGWVGRIPAAGPVIVGLFFALAAVAAVVALVLLVGTWFGFPFMWPTIAMEGTDAFDAISRSFNYFFARPVKTLACFLAALVYGTVAVGIVAGAVHVSLALALAGVGFGMGSHFSEIGMCLGYGATPEACCALPGAASVGTIGGMLLLRIVIIMAWVLVLGFIVSFKISAWTAIYAVLRRDVDGTGMGEVYEPEPEEETPAIPAATPKAEAEVKAEPPAAPADAPAPETPPPPAATPGEKPPTP